MKIGISGTSKLAGYMIENVDAEWVDTRINTGSIGRPNDINDCDVFINHWHHMWDQVHILDQLSRQWWDDDTKTIINISSRAAQPNISKGRMYAAQKAALNHLCDNLTYNSDKKFKLVTLNLGLIEGKYDLPALTYKDISDTIEFILKNDHLEFSSVTLAHKHNYLDVQRKKAELI